MGCVRRAFVVDVDVVGKLSEVMRILQFMVKDAHLDGDLCDLIVGSGVIRGYADEGLKEWQKDDFEWKGKTYSYWQGDGESTTP